MIAVLGLDVSCNATGVALPSGRCLTARPNTTDIGARLRWIAEHITRHVRIYKPAVVVLEGYNTHSPGVTSTIRIAEAGGVVRFVLHGHRVPWVEVAPKQLKRYATNNGNAAKDVVVESARHAGAQVDDDDQADAWWLRAIGLHALDGRLPDDRTDTGLTKARLDVVAALDWPRVT